MVTVKLNACSLKSDIFGEINELFMLKKLFMKLTFDIFGNLFDNDLTFEIFIRI